MQGGDGGGENLLVGLVKLFLHLVGETVDDAAVFDTHHIDVSVFVVGHDAKDIHVLHRGVDDG